MKIKDIDFFRLDMPLVEPYTIAYETVTETTNIILKLTLDNGLNGWGCAAPDMEVTSENPEQVIDNIKQVVIALLKGESPFHIARINQTLKENLGKSSSTRAMVDMALYDLMARKARLPLYKLLGGFRDSIPTSITIGIVSVDETIKKAGIYLKQGFSILKLKGGLNLAEDIEKVNALRKEFGKKFLLRFDANQGYSEQEALQFIKKTRLAGIEIFEQPINPKSEQSMGLITSNVDVPVMADESIKTLKDTFRLARNNVIDMVNIKLMKVGGILESQHINSVAKAAGLEVMVGCLDECTLGISAGLHFALSRPNVEYADLDGHLDLLKDPFAKLFTLQNGILYPSQEDGLGKINI